MARVYDSSDNINGNTDSLSAQEWIFFNNVINVKIYMYTLSWIITFDTVRCCFLLPQKIVKGSFWNFLMTPVCFHFECSKKLVLYGAIVWLGSKAFIFCLFVCRFFCEQVFSNYYASALAVGVGVWHWRWHWHFFSYPLLCSWQIQRNDFTD